MKQELLETPLKGAGTANRTARRKPHFYIRASTVKNNRIPPKFIEEHGKSLLSPVRLRVSTGTTWDVQLSPHREGGHHDLCFQQGWPKFATIYSIKEGNILLFRYEGNSLFHVTLFGADEIEIDKLEQQEDAGDGDDCYYIGERSVKKAPGTERPVKKEPGTERPVKMEPGTEIPVKKEPGNEVPKERERSSGEKKEKKRERERSDGEDYSDNENVRAEVKRIREVDARRKFTKVVSRKLRKLERDMEYIKGMIDTVSYMFPSSSKSGEIGKMKKKVNVKMEKNEEEEGEENKHEEEEEDDEDKVEKEPEESYEGERRE